jgi:hypothetical protein
MTRKVPHSLRGGSAQRKSPWEGAVQEPRSPYHPEYTLRELREVLESGEILLRKPLGSGTVAAPELWTIKGQDGTVMQAIAKDAQAVDSMTSPFPVPWGETSKREVTVYDLAIALGVADIPMVTGRTEDGHFFSVMEFVKDVPTVKDYPSVPEQQDTFVQSQAEPDLLFNAAVHAGDGHPANFLVDGAERMDVGTGTPAINTGEHGARSSQVSHRIIPIDLGLALPAEVQGAYFRWPFEWARSWSGPVLSSTLRLVASWDAPAVIRMLREDNYPREVTRHIARNVERIRKNPDALEVNDDTVAVEEYNPLYPGNAEPQLKGLSDWLRRDHEGLTADELGNIELQLDLAYGPRGSRESQGAA